MSMDISASALFLAGFSGARFSAAAFFGADFSVAVASAGFRALDRRESTFACMLPMTRRSEAPAVAVNAPG
jgi:hypothetical protein